MELGIWIKPVPGDDLRLSLDAEREGFDLTLYGDSQNLFPDPFARMAMVAARTSRIRVASGVTNPVTRDPAVTASTIAAIHAESGGRAVLGIGSGDSALGYLGLDYPAPLDVFATYVRRLRGYLRGEEVDLDGFPSRLHWLPEGLPPVPVDVSCTGPRTIRFAAATVDRVTLTVGAAPERIRWGVETAREGMARAGRDPAEVQLGAWLVVGVADDPREACEALRSTVAVLGHFSGMKGAPLDSLPPILRRVAEGLRPAFERTEGGTRNDEDYMRAVASCVDDEFVEWFSVVGRPQQVAAKLQALEALGLGHVSLVFGSPVADAAFVAESRARFVREVMPLLRAGRL